MESRRPRALLIGENRQGSSYLATRLEGRGFACDFALSYQQACSLLRAQGFDVVLSPMKLRVGSLFPLIDLLAGCPIFLFFYQAVEEGCWWLPALRFGEKCFGSSALRPSEFVAMLDESIAQICFRASVERKSPQPSAPQLPGSFARLRSSRGDLPPAEPKPVARLTLCHKAAG